MTRRTRTVRHMRGREAEIQARLERAETMRIVGRRNACADTSAIRIEETKGRAGQHAPFSPQYSLRLQQLASDLVVARMSSAALGMARTGMTAATRVTAAM
jgi:hypothetical protein